MPEMHISYPGLTYSACKLLTKHKERIQKFRDTGDWRYIYQNKLDKGCFQHDMSYGDFKDLASRTVSNKRMRDKAFNLDKNLKYGG